MYLFFVLSVGGYVKTGVYHRRIYHLSPSFNAVFDHEIFREGCRYIDHVIAIVFFTHALLPVATDCKTEISRFGRSMLVGHYGPLKGHIPTNLDTSNLTL